jgi:hypothetical protein
VVPVKGVKKFYGAFDGQCLEFDGRVVIRLLEVVGALGAHLLLHDYISGEGYEEEGLRLEAGVGVCLLRDGVCLLSDEGFQEEVGTGVRFCGLCKGTQDGFSNLSANEGRVRVGMGNCIGILPS